MIVTGIIDFIIHNAEDNNYLTQFSRAYTTIRVHLPPKKKDLQFDFILLEYILLFLMSASPIGEGRMALAIGIMSNLDPLTIYLVCLFANMLSFTLCRAFLDWANEKLWKYQWYKKLSLKMGKKIRKQFKKRIDKYGFWALLIFSSMPLPGTGAWSGTIASYIFGVDKKKARIAIPIGVSISNTIAALILYSAHELL